MSRRANKHTNVSTEKRKQKQAHEKINKWNEEEEEEKYSLFSRSQTHKRKHTDTNSKHSLHTLEIVIEKGKRFAIFKRQFLFYWCIFERYLQRESNDNGKN